MKQVVEVREISVPKNKNAEIPASKLLTFQREISALICRDWQNPEIQADYIRWKAERAAGKRVKNV